jgi:fluoride ion exporter CrcB/FEX
MIITGFCGGLTTFSTFSAEVVSLLQAGQPVWAMGAIAGQSHSDIIGDRKMPLSSTGWKSR